MTSPAGKRPLNGWLQRQRNIVDFTLSSLMRRAGRNTALSLVYTAVVFMLGSVMFFSHALKREASVILQASPEIIVQRMVAGRHDLIPVAYADSIKGIRGVGSVRGRLWGYYFEPSAGANFTLMVPEEPVEQGTVVIGKGIARSLKASEGDILPLKSHLGTWLVLSVEKVISGNSELVSSDLVLISESDFRKVFGVPPGVFTDLTLTVRNSLELNTIAGKIKNLHPDTRPIVKDEILRTYASIFNWRSGLLFAVLSGSVLAFIIFSWDKASGLSAEERREIGILKAIGWETSDIILMKFWEGLAVSLSSFLAGLILAYVHVFFASSVFFEPVLKGWSVLYPEFRLTPFVDGTEVLSLFLLVVLPYTTATIVPSWRAATVDPDSVMRS